MDQHDQQFVTLGEVYRKLCAVHEQTVITNGRVNRHEAAIAVLQWAIGLVGVAALAVFGAMLAKVW
jgi:hypothetical protein